MLYKLTIPVLLIAYDRPDLTQLVFNKIREVKPEKLFFAASAAINEKDNSKCQEVKDIIKQVDWDCQVHTLFPEENPGSTYGPINAINWVFANVDKAIILEDDCVPNVSFFKFCSELLEYYKDEKRVYSIGGSVLLASMPRLKYSYWFSPVNCHWGWATWRRSWSQVDFQMKEWSRLRETNWLEKRIGNAYIAAYHREGIEEAYRTRGSKDFVGWDYVSHYSMLLNDGVHIWPSVNLVSNMGFREDARHTKQKTTYSDLPTQEIKFPLNHPPEIVTSIKLDIELYKQIHPSFKPCKFKLCVINR